MPFEEQTVSIFAGTQGFIDAVPVKDVVRFEQAMLADIRANHPGILTDIRDKREMTKDTTDALKSALTAFGKAFA